MTRSLRVRLQCQDFGGKGAGGLNGAGVFGAQRVKVREPTSGQIPTRNERNAYRRYTRGIQGVYRG